MAADILQKPGVSPPYSPAVKPAHTRGILLSRERSRETNGISSPSEAKKELPKEV